MRIAVSIDGQGMINMARLGLNPAFLEVLLDGIKQRCAVAADEEEGWVIRYVLLPAGGLLLGNDREPVMQIERGRVEIRVIARQDGSWPHAVPAVVHGEDGSMLLRDCVVGGVEAIPEVFDTDTHLRF